MGLSRWRLFESIP